MMEVRYANRRLSCFWDVEHDDIEFTIREHVKYYKRLIHVGPGNDTNDIPVSSLVMSAKILFKKAAPEKRRVLGIKLTTVPVDEVTVKHTFEINRDTKHISVIEVL